MTTTRQPPRCAGRFRLRPIGALLPALLLLLTGLLAPTMASAHAALDRSTPTNGDVLSAWPATVSATFTERLDDSYSRLQLFDTEGREIEETELSFDSDGYSMTLAVPANLPNGTYSILWRTLSEDDGHTAQNYFSFTVGSDQDIATVTIPGTGTDTGGPPQWLKTASRGAALVGIAALIAVWPIWTLVVRPGLTPVWRQGPAITRRMHRYTAGAIVAALGGSIFALIVQALTLADGSWFDKIINTLGQTRYGQLWMARVALIIITGLLLSVVAWWFTQRRTAERWLAWLATLALPIPFSLIAHAYAQPAGRAFAVTSDVLHLLAAGIWAGGLLILAIVLLPGLRAVSAEERRRVLATAVPRFSIIAIVCWATMGLSGLYAGWLQVGNLAALTGTDYGRALIVKLVLLLIVLVIAAYNLIVVSRQLRRQGGGLWSRRLGGTIVAEAALVLLALVAVGQMTSLQPARDVMVERAQQVTIPFELPEGDSARLLLAPGTTGVNHFRVEIPGDALPTDTEALLRLTMPGNSDLGTKEIQLSRVSGNAFEHHGSELSIAGDWQMTLIVREPGTAPINVQTSQTVGSEAPNVDVPGAPWRFKTLGGLSGLVLIVVSVGAFAMAVTAGRSPMRKEAGGLGAAALALGLVLLVQARYDPILVSASGRSAIDPDNLAMVERGEEIYVAQCLSCHGAELRGDGPAGEGMDPAPADFSESHTMVHADEDLVYWVKNGKQGTGMPGFDAVLSDQEILDVLAYIQNRQAELGKEASVPDPAACTVAPRSIEHLEAVVAAGGEPARQRGGTLQPASDPAVDDATRDAIVQATDQMVACGNAVDTLRRLALFSDDYLREAFPDGVDQAFVQMATQTPVPLPENERAGIRDIRNVTRLVDGRIAATVSLSDPVNGDAQATLVFVDVNGTWLIDEMR